VRKAWQPSEHYQKRPSYHTWLLKEAVRARRLLFCGGCWPTDLLSHGTCVYSREQLLRDHEAARCVCRLAEFYPLCEANQNETIRSAVNLKTAGHLRLLDRAAEGVSGWGIAALPSLGNLKYDCCCSDTS
jgi:hypothetical protein